MMRVKNVQTLLEEDIFRVKEKRYVTDYLSRDRNDLMSYEKGVGVFDGLCDFGQSLWNQYQNGEDIDLLEAAVVDFGAGTIGSLAEQIISGDGIDIGDALYDGVMNTVEGLAFGKQSVKGLGDAIKRGAKAGAATSIVDNIHNAVTGGSGTGAGAGFGMLGLGINSGLSQMQSRDPKTACGSTNPFSSGINFNGSNGYQNWIANGSVNRTGNGFSLADTLGDIVNDTIWGGVGSAAQYGGGKLVEGLENFVSKRWNKSGINSNGIVNGKTPASRFADKLRGLSNSKRPNTVAVVRTADGKYYAGYNKAGIHNNNIQKVLDYLGNNNLYNRQCAEVNAISRAFNDGADLKGATISIANVRKASDVSGVHGTYKAPCDVCQPLIDFFGIEDIN